MAVSDIQAATSYVSKTTHLKTSLGYNALNRPLKVYWLDHL